MRNIGPRRVSDRRCACRHHHVADLAAAHRLAEHLEFTRQSAVVRHHLAAFEQRHRLPVARGVFPLPMSGRHRMAEDFGEQGSHALGMLRLHGQCALPGRRGTNQTQGQTLAPALAQGQLSLLQVLQRCRDIEALALEQPALRPAPR
jgi:hypothetical protein